MDTYTLGQPAVPTTMVDASVRFTSQYNVAIKCYLHRNFDRSLTLIYPLIKEIRNSPACVDAIDPVLKTKLIKLYLSLLALFLNEYRNHQLLDLSTHKHSLNFSNYLASSNPATEEILLDFNNAGIYNLIAQLGMMDQYDIVLMGFTVELDNNFNRTALKNQVETYLKLQNILPTVTDQTRCGHRGLKKIVEFYLSQIIMDESGIDGAIQLIQRMFVYDSDAGEKWLGWIKSVQLETSRAAIVENDATLAEDGDSDDAVYDLESDYDDESDLTDDTHKTFPSELQSRSSSTSMGLVKAHTPAIAVSKSHSTDRSKKSRNKSRKSRKSKNRDKEAGLYHPENQSHSVLADFYQSVKVQTQTCLQRYSSLLSLVFLVIMLLTIPRKNLKQNILSFHSRCVKSLRLALKVNGNG